MANTRDAAFSKPRYRDSELERGPGHHCGIWTKWKHVGGHGFEKTRPVTARVTVPINLNSCHSPDPTQYRRQRGMGWISDLADEDLPPEASSSKVNITNGASCLQNTGGAVH